MKFQLVFLLIVSLCLFCVRVNSCSSGQYSCFIIFCCTCNVGYSCDGYFQYPCYDGTYTGSSNQGTCESCSPGTYTLNDGNPHSYCNNCYKDSINLMRVKVIV